MVDQQLNPCRVNSSSTTGREARSIYSMSMAASNKIYFVFVFSRSAHLTKEEFKLTRKLPMTEFASN